MLCCHTLFLLKNNTKNMNAHETPILRTFKLCTLQKYLQHNPNIVIVMSSKTSLLVSPHDIGVHMHLLVSWYEYIQDTVNGI